jgi:hypothetical protein
MLRVRPMLERLSDRRDYAGGQEFFSRLGRELVRDSSKVREQGCVESEERIVTTSRDRSPVHRLFAERRNSDASKDNG